MLDSLLRAVWRHLPVGPRRILAHRALALFSPGLPEAAAAAQADNAPVIVVGFLTSPSGLGQSARLAYLALVRQGRDVYGVDLSHAFFEAPGCVPFGFRDGRTHRGAARVLININAPYLRYVFHILGRGFLHKKWITGYWAWESSRVPADWRAGLSCVHDVAVPSVFVADSVRTLGEVPPIHIAPHPIMLESLPNLPGRAVPVSAAAPFTIVSALNVASGFERKNPLGLIAAFRAAFAGRSDVQLRMLVSNVDHYAPARRLLETAILGEQNIALTYATFDRESYWRWYGQPDLYASLHRAEGFGLPLAESMAVGVPVLATHWSANVEYMNAENALPVAYRLVQVRDAQRKYPEDGAQWAEADLAHASDLMCRAVLEPEWLQMRARAGQASVRRLFTQFHPWE